MAGVLQFSVGNLEMTTYPGLFTDPEPTAQWLLQFAAHAAESHARAGLPPTTYTSGGVDLRAEQRVYDTVYERVRADIAQRARLDGEHE